jgi:serine/threonine protein kinase
VLAPNTLLQNRYRIVRQLGQGGMGAVYEAVDQRLDTVVALKETLFSDELLRKQFEREARLLAKLRHSAMTRVVDHFAEGDGQFLVMDFVAGEDLWHTLQRTGTPFSTDEVLKWANQLLEVLDFLHAQNPPVIHRDIKPQNLKVTSNNQIILLDFGLAKGFAGQISRVTPSGSIFGFTPNYAPLEQIQGIGTDQRSDLYSLSATLYHLLTNVMPADVLTRAGAIVGGQPDPLRPADETNPHVPHAFANVLTQGTAINRELRPATAREMLKSLNQVTQPASPASEAKTLLRQPGSVDSAPDPSSQERPPANADPMATQAAQQQSPGLGVLAVKKPAPDGLPLTTTIVSPAPEFVPTIPSDEQPQSATSVAGATQPQTTPAWQWIITALVLSMVVGSFVLLTRSSQSSSTTPATSNGSATNTPTTAPANTASTNSQTYVHTEDDRIKEDIETKFDNYKSFEDFQVYAEVDNGHVTLNGTAQSSHDKRQAAKLARSVRGVRSVDNQVTVEVSP